MSAHLYTCVISQGSERWVGFGISGNIERRREEHKRNLARAGFGLSAWKTYQVPDISTARKIEEKVKRNTRAIDLRVDGFRCETAPIEQREWIAQILVKEIKREQSVFRYESAYHQETPRTNQSLATDEEPRELKWADFWGQLDKTNLIKGILIFFTFCASFNGLFGGLILVASFVIIIPALVYAQICAHQKLRWLRKKVWIS